MNNFQNPYNNMYQPRYSYSPTNNGITWVQGVEGAKAYQLMPNSNMLLMDSENDGVFYIKVSDNVGMCNLRTFKYEEVTNFPKSSENLVDTSQFVTKDELNEILNKRFNGGKNNGKQPVQPTKPVITE